MFADPLAPVSAFALTNAAEIAGASYLSFVATGRGPLSSTYRYSYSSTNYIDMLISRQVGKRTRFTVRLTETELVPDPTNSELNVAKTSTVYIVADRGVLGDATHQTIMEQILSYFLFKPTDSTTLFSRVRGGET